MAKAFRRFLFPGRGLLLEGSLLCLFLRLLLCCRMVRFLLQRTGNQKVFKKHAVAFWELQKGHGIKTPFVGYRCDAIRPCIALKPLQISIPPLISPLCKNLFGDAKDG